MYWTRLPYRIWSNWLLSTWRTTTLEITSQFNTSSRALENLLTLTWEAILLPRHPSSMKALLSYFQNFVTYLFIYQRLEIFDKREISEQERKYLMGLIQQKELRVARNHSLINDSSLTKIIDGNTTVDSILSPKVSQSKLGSNRYGSKIRINENSNSPSN